MIVIGFGPVAGIQKVQRRFYRMPAPSARGQALRGHDEKNTPRPSSNSLSEERRDDIRFTRRLCSNS